MSYEYVKISGNKLRIAGNQMKAAHTIFAINGAVNGAITSAINPIKTPVGGLW
jgi:hypothetical protein